MSFLSPWVQLALTAGNAVGSALNSRRGARTSSFSRSESQSGVTMTRRRLLPEQEEALGLLSDRIRTMLTAPEAGLRPLRLAQRSKVNATFSAAPTALAAKFLRSGQPSGKYGRAARMTELARLGELSDVDTAFAGYSIDRRDRALSLAERLLAQNFGTDVSTSMAAKSAGTGVGPGSALGSAVSGGLEALTTLMTINRILQEGT